MASQKSGFVVVEELMCRPDCLGIGRSVMQRWRHDATVGMVVKSGVDWVVRSGQVLWTVNGIANLLNFQCVKIPRKKDVAAGARCLEDLLQKATDPLAEMKKDNGSRLLVVTWHGQVPRFIEGMILGDGRTVRVRCGVVKPEIRSQIVVRPNELQPGSDIYIYP